MLDFKLLGFCDHRVQEQLIIDGVSPNFTSTLSVPSNKNKEKISILELSSTDDLEMFGANIPGITNYNISSDGQQLIFGIYPVDEGMLFPDPNPNYVPQNIYICSYIAKESECPKCKGSKRNNDIHIDSVGRVETISGHNKAKQQLIKALLTIRGSNFFDGHYGSDLSNSIGSKIDEFFVAKLQFSILQTLDHLITIQAEQGIPDDERIISISDISANRDLLDPRSIKINVIVTLADYNEISTGMIITL